MTKPARPKRKLHSLLKGLKGIVGVGMYLLVLGLVLEALTLVVRRWVSYPIILAVGSRIALTLPCLVLCLLGVVWFNRSLNLPQIHLLGGENKLITHGPFNYVRHPLYATLLITLPPLMIIWYADLVFIIPWAVMLMAAHWVVLLEERGLIRIFGEDYETYREYVPALLPYKGAGGRRYREQRDRAAPGQSGRGAD